MLKNMSQLEVIVENKICRFQCEIDTPIHFVKEALFQFQKYIGQAEDNAKAKKEKEDEEKNREEIVKEPEIIEVE